MVMVLSSNKSCNQEINKLKNYNDNLMFGNPLMIIIGTTFDMYIISYS